MLTVLAVILLALVAAAATIVFVLHRRIEAGARAKAAAKAIAKARLEEGRRRGELDYVLSKMDAELTRLTESTPVPSEKIARMQELRDVLRQSFVASSTSFPISGPCAEVVDAFRAQAGVRELLYSESGDGRWLHVQGDRALLRWAMGEMLVNTALHAGDWSRVAILAEPGDGVVVLSVRDDGQGVTQSVAARLCSPFTPRFASPGPGLGLYAVRVIAERLGGTVEVSGSPGQGLVHRLRLPHPPEGPYGAAATTTRNPAAADRAQEHV